MCLTDLGLTQVGIITAIDAADPHVQRLMVLGLVEGAELKHLSSVGSTTLEFKIHNGTIAFSKEQAQHFTVELV